MWFGSENSCEMPAKGNAMMAEVSKKKSKRGRCGTATSCLQIVFFCCLLILASHDTARANPPVPYAQLSTAQQQAIVDELERGGATQPYYTALSSEEQAVWQHESDAHSPGLAQDLFRARVALGLLQDPEQNIGAIPLNDQALDQGWKIGSGPNAKWVHLGNIGPVQYGGQLTAPTHLAPAAAGQGVFTPLISTTPESGGFNEVLMPERGWYFQFGPGLHSGVNYSVTPAGIRCNDISRDQIPTGLTRVAGFGRFNCVIPSTVEGYYVSEWGLFDRPIEDYAAQPVDYTSAAPNRPTRAQEEAAAANFFGSSSGSMLLDWYENQDPADDPYARAAADAFRPELLFDGPDTSAGAVDTEGEQYRPLNIEQFLAEPDPAHPGHSLNTIVDPAGGQDDTIGSWTDLRQYSSPDAYVNAGTQPSDSTDPSAYKSPYAACLAGLRDCDSNHTGDPTADGKTAIYYHSSFNAADGYNYIDYWFWYRYNEFPVTTADDHQLDLEGMTIAPSRSGKTFDFASFSQHGTWYTYLKSALHCAPSAGPCGNTSQRIDDYVAFGDHANYQELCDNSGITCPSGSSAIAFDTPHNGGAPWLANDDPSALIRMPDPVGWQDPAQAVWTDWPGKWGADLTVGSPAGLGGNGDHFRSPGTATVVNSAHESARRRNTECANWFGAGVRAIACSPRVLKHALKTRTLGQRGSVRLVVGHKPDPWPVTAPGIAQSLGSALTAGDVVRVLGRRPADTELLLRGEDHGYWITARFSPSQLRGGRLTIRVVGRGAQLHFSRIDRGRAQRAQTLQRRRLSPPRYPRLQHATHRR
jgi:hypothetical protein